MRCHHSAFISSLGLGASRVTVHSQGYIPIVAVLFHVHKWCDPCGTLILSVQRFDQSEFHRSFMEVTVNHTEDVQTFAAVKARHTGIAHFPLFLYLHIVSDTADIASSDFLFRSAFPSCFAALTEQNPGYTECSSCPLCQWSSGWLFTCEFVSEAPFLAHYQ